MSCQIRRWSLVLRFLDGTAVMSRQFCLTSGSCLILLNYSNYGAHKGVSNLKNRFLWILIFDMIYFARFKFQKTFCKLPNNEIRLHFRQSCIKVRPATEDGCSRVNFWSHWCRYSLEIKIKLNCLFLGRDTRN